MVPFHVLEESDFYDALVARRHELGWSQMQTDLAAMLTSGHCGKIERPGSRWGKRPFVMNRTCERVMTAYGVTLVMVEDRAVDALHIEQPPTRPIGTRGPGYQKMLPMKLPVATDDELEKRKFRELAWKRQMARAGMLA